MTSRTARIAVLCSFNLDLLQRPMKEALTRLGLNAELHFTGYGLWETESLDLQSKLHEFRPEVVILFADSADLMPPLQLETSLPKVADAVAQGHAAWTRVATAVEALSAGFSEQVTLLVHNLRPQV